MLFLFADTTNDSILSPMTGIERTASFRRQPTIEVGGYSSPIVLPGTPLFSEEESPMKRTDTQYPFDVEEELPAAAVQPTDTPQNTETSVEVRYSPTQGKD